MGRISTRSLSFCTFASLLTPFACLLFSTLHTLTHEFTTLYTVVNAALAPLPVDEGNRIQVLRNFNTVTSAAARSSSQDFVRWREELTSFGALGAATTGASYNVISEDGRAAPVQSAEVTASAFDILRVPPLLGRVLIPADEVVGAPAVVLIGYDLWQSRLGGDPDVVGRSVRIGGVPHEVVGVMPEGFLFPFRDHLWLPLRLNVLAEEPGNRGTHLVFGRLSDGVSPEEAFSPARVSIARFDAAAVRFHASAGPTVRVALSPERPPAPAAWPQIPLGAP